MDVCTPSSSAFQERERERHPVRAGAGEGERLGELSTGGEVKEGRTTTTNQRRPIDFKSCYD